MSVFPPYRGGISRFSDYVFKNIEKTEDIEAFNFELLYPNLLFPGTTQFEENSTQEYDKRVMHSYNPYKWRQTARLIVQRRPKILLFSYWHPFFIPGFNSVIKYAKKNLTNLKVVSIAHNVVPHESFPFSSTLMQSFLKKNDGVITLSDQTTSEFNSLKVSQTKNLKLFHPIYETDKPTESASEIREKYGFKSQDFILLFFGLIREYKGLDLLIKALNELDLPKLNIKPLIVGEFYDDKQKYIDLIKPEHLHFYTIIDRFVTADESAEVFTISDLLALPYKTASQSGVLADALNFELPPIVSNQPGVTEYLENEKNSLIFESENIEQLKSLLIKYLNNSNLQNIINNNLRVLKAKLSWKSFTEQLIYYLNNL